MAFEPKMLEFYSTERLVRTPSASQVRKPIYKSSVQAWKKYEQHLQPLVEALGDESTALIFLLINSFLLTLSADE